MKTSVSVMGIQTKNIMERISITLKAVLKTGKENKKVQVVEKEEEGVEEPRVISAKDPVFREDRLMEEIPEPNWAVGVIAPPNGMVDHTHMSPLAKRHAKKRDLQQLALSKANQKKTKDARRAHLVLVASAQTENKQPHEIRDLRSSPSPPVAT